MRRRDKVSVTDNSATRETTAIEQKNLAGKDEQVAVAAYFKAEKRHFDTGHELEDWLEAKAELETETQ